MGANQSDNVREQRKETLWVEKTMIGVDLRSGWQQDRQKKATMGSAGADEGGSQQRH